MNLYSNMEFEMKSTFIPNISKSDKLKVIEVTDGSVIVQMENSNCRGVFPLDNFQYWIKRSSLVHINEHAKKTS
ncbi:hypothetical protein [Neobacillus sp. D3-1R]|uniref:hypothetical protein n=1 Tax=Neobacillus sp. D3-1R TaxID=3445778 RepID=UPI003FA19483